MENNERFLKKLCVLEPLDHFAGQTEPLTLNDEKLGASKDPPIWPFGHLWRGNETDLEICALKAEGITLFLFLAVEMNISYSAIMNLANSRNTTL